MGGGSITAIKVLEIKQNLRVLNKRLFLQVKLLNTVIKTPGFEGALIEIAHFFYFSGYHHTQENINSTSSDLTIRRAHQNTACRLPK